MLDLPSSISEHSDPSPALAPADLDLVGLASMASTMTRRNIIRFRGIYKILYHIWISVPNPNDRVTSRLEGGITLYEAFLHVGLRFSLHPFILSLLDHYQLIPTQLVPNAFRIVSFFVILYHFHRIIARFSLYWAIYAMKQYLTKEGWWFKAP